MEERRKIFTDASKLGYELTITRMELANAELVRDEMKKKIEGVRNQDAALRERVSKTRKFYNELLNVAKSARTNVNNIEAVLALRRNGNWIVELLK